MTDGAHDLRREPHRELREGDASGYRELLVNSLREHRTDVRVTFQLLVGWFTFFISVMLASIGWCAKAMLDGAPKTDGLISFVAAFFIVQIVLGAIACAVVRSFLRRSSALLSRIAAELTAPGATKLSPEELEISSAFMRRAIAVMIATLAVYAAAWVAIAVLRV